LMARIRSWFCLVAQPDRYIIHKKDGFIQVILSILNGGETKVWFLTADSAIVLL
jgi:hypothetical protein